MVMRMEHENDIKEALDFVSPSALTYEEWLMVGMGLKEAGLPVCRVGAVERPGRRAVSQGRVHQKMGEFPRQLEARHPEQHLPAGPMSTAGPALQAMRWTGVMS